MSTISCVKTFDGILTAIKRKLKLINKAKNPESKLALENDLREWIQKLGKATAQEKTEVLTELDVQELYEQFKDVSSTPVSFYEFESWLVGKEVETPEKDPRPSPDSIENYTGNMFVSTDFIDRVYGESSTRAGMLRTFNSGIIRSIIVDLKHNKEILGDETTLNAKITEFKEELYLKVRAYVKLETHKELPAELFEIPDSTNIRKNVGLAAVNEIIKDGPKELLKMYTLSQDPRLLSTWKLKSIGHDESFKVKLDGYNAYFMLSHFDSLLIDQFGLFIKCLQSEIDHIDSSAGKYSYGTVIDAETVKNWQLEDLYTKSAYDLIPKHLQRLIESLEIFTKEDEDPTKLKPTGQYLTKNHLIYFIKLIKKSFRNDKRELLAVSVNDAKSMETLISKISDKFPDIDYESKVHIALALKEARPINNMLRISLGDLVNEIRDHNDLGLKALFDVRRALDLYHMKEFPSKMERRLFYNLYDYLFANDGSLYSSSRFLFGELASLFDVTSVVDHTEYKIDEKGFISVVELNPANKNRIKEIRKRNINSAFVPGQMERYIEKYGGELKNRNIISKTNTTREEREVRFHVNGSDGKPFWTFVYTPPEDKWVMYRKNPRNPQGEEMYDASAVEANGKIPARAKLTESDLLGLNGFIIDTLGIDFANRPELWDALIDIFNKDNAVITEQLRTNLTRLAITRLLDICVRIYANALMFRLNTIGKNVVHPGDPILFDKRYRFVERNVPDEEGTHDVESFFYTTVNDKMYSKTKLTAEGEITIRDRDEEERKFGRRDVIFKTKEQLRELIDSGKYEIEISEPHQFADLIESWYGVDKRDQVRTNPVYEGIDIISTKTDTEYLEPIIELEALSTGATYKNLVDTAERTKITLGGSSMLFYEKFSRLAQLGKDPTNPMAILNEFLSTGFVGNSFARDLDNRPDVKLCKDFNFKENFYACFVADFLLPMFMLGDRYGATNIRFTDTVNSDKPNNPKLDIFRGEIRPYDDMVKLTKYALGDAHIACFRNIEDDFEKLCDFYNTKTKLPKNQYIEITMDDNFDSFNAWCERRSKELKRKVTPLELLGRMVAYYNKYNRENPLAFYQGIHYTENEDGTFYINRSFVESLLRYGSYTTGSYNDRIANIEDTLRRIKDDPEKFDLTLHLNHLLENLRKHLPDIGKWQQTLARLEKRYKAETGPSNKELQEIRSNINYEDFINYSNYDFLTSILKSDVTLDLKAVEHDMQLNDCLGKITRGMKSEDADEWKRLWTTYFHDRMAFGYVKVKAPETNEFVELQDPIHPNRPRQIASRIDLHGFYNKLGDRIISSTDREFSLTKKLYCLINGQEYEAKIEMNPLLKQYNINHHYWTSLSNLSITGSHVWSDAKKFTRTLEEESAKWFDSVKRNVINSATSTQFKVGSVWGIPTEAKIAVIKDIRALCSGILGDTPVVKPYDGATFVNPFMYYWENYSLNNLITGYTKKPIYEFYNERLMAGGLIKTASFALSNKDIRNSVWKERAMWKMTNMLWINPNDPNLNLLDVDLTLGRSEYVENKEDPNRKFDHVIISGITADLKYKGVRGLMYFDLYNEVKETGTETEYPSKRVVKEIYSFRKIKNHPKGYTNYYEIVTRLIDPNTGKYYENADGTPMYHIETKMINSNYTFWKALGGYNSVERNTETGKFDYSEKSMEVVAEWAGKIRFNKMGELLQLEVYKSEFEWLTSSKFTKKEQDILAHDSRLWYNPLKDSNIHYIVTEGAIKKGAANMNTVSEYSNDKLLNFYKIKLTLAGIQLDPEHEADLSEISLMTLVISGLADRGYTTALADEVYTALADLSNLATLDSYLAFLLAYEQADRLEILKIVTGLLIDEILQSKSDQRTTNLARAIANKFINSAMRGEDLSFDNIAKAFPFSDGSIFELLQSTVTSAINKKAIREKMFGSLSVLNPSYNIHKIYGNKQLGDIQNFDEVKKILDNFDKKLLNSITETEIGRCYTIIQKDKNGDGYGYDGELIELKDSDYYYQWKILLKGQNYKLKETIYTYDPEVLKVKDIKSFRERVEQENRQFGYYELTYSSGEKRVLRIGDASDFAHLSNKNVLLSVRKINLYGRELGSYNIHMNIVTQSEPKHLNRYDLSSVLDAAYRNIKKKITKAMKKLKYSGSLNEDQWKAVLAETGVSQDKMLLWKTAYKSKVKDISKVEEEKLLQKELSAIEKGRKLRFYDEDGLLLEAKIASHSITHFEAILPMIYATLFGIRKGDSLGVIRLDPNFFFKRMLENYMAGNDPGKDAYDICVKRADGKHIYIKYAGDLKLIDNGFLEIKLRRFKDPSDNIFRLDPFSRDKRLHVMSSMEDKIYQHPTTSKEVIVTKDIAFYLKNLDYTGIHFSDNIVNEKEALLMIVGALKNNSRTVARYIGEYIENDGIEDYLIKQKTLIQKIKEYQTSSDKKTAAETLKALNNKIIGVMYDNAMKQHASFLESLKFTVARIPAQGMQSFMAMDIVGFNESGVNDCFVSAEQIRLLGSDYDVDKATFLGHAFDKAGQFITWSDYFKTRTYEELEESKVLPFPTGLRGTAQKGTENSFDYSKYKSLFTKVEKKEKSKTTTEVEEKEKNETSSTENAKWNLKYYRKLALLAELIKEVNKVGKAYFSEHEKDKTFTLTYANAEDKDFVEALISVVNRHNTFINRMSKESRSDALKNFIAARVFTISENPANALVGETSVDVVSLPLKDKADESNVGHKPTESRPGNASTQWSALELNLTGKDVIGITASNGVKCYFGLSHVLNKAILDNKVLTPYEFDVRFVDRETGQVKHYHFIANTNIDLNTDLTPSKLLQDFKLRINNSKLSDDQIQWLYNRYINQNEWAGSYISGILSLATDNAKELKLDQLNAGRDLAGLYLYGLLVGIPIDDIYRAMTSPTALVLARIMKTNGFTYDDIAKNLNRAIKFIEEDQAVFGPRRMTVGQAESLISDFADMNLQIEGLDHAKTFKGLVTLPDMSSRDSIIEIIKRGQFDTYMKRLRYIKDDLISYQDYVGRQKKKALGQNEWVSGYTWELIDVKRSLDKFIHYAYDIYEIYKASLKEKINVWADLENIKTLNKGFSELGQLRALLGLNLGVKTKSADKLKFYEDFAQLISKRYPDKIEELHQRLTQLEESGPDGKKSDEYKRLINQEEDIKAKIKRTLDKEKRIDFLKFFTDTQYRKDVIEIYDLIKHTVNPLRIVTELPHFNAYLRAAFLDYSNCSISSKFRAMTTVIMPHLDTVFKPRDKNLQAAYIRRALSFIDGIITNRWLQERPALILPKGAMIVRWDGSMVKSEEDFSVELGTLDGNATFQYWMNQEVIPRLKEGLTYGHNVSERRGITTKGTDDVANTFLRDLIPNITNKTLDRNNMSIYSLPIDMIPKSDIEADRLSKYKLDFNELNQYDYKINKNTSYNVVDLFFYYNLINFRNRGGEQSLTPLLETLIQTNGSPILRDYIGFVAEFDREYDILPNVDFTWAEFDKFVAPSNREVRVASAGASKIPYYWNLNKDTLKYELYRYLKPDREIDEKSLSYMERLGYIKDSTGESPLHVYSLSFSVIEDLSDTPTPIEMSNASVEVSLKGSGRDKRLEISNATIKAQDGGTFEVSATIQGEELKKLIKVRKKGDEITYKINPVSLLIYLSAKRRLECNK